MERPLIQIFWARLQARTRRLIHRLRNLKFRQIMGAVYILRVFNPLYILLALVLFVVLMARDVRTDARLNQSLAGVTQNLEVIERQVYSLGQTLQDLQDDFQWLSQVVGLLRKGLDVVAGIINGIIDFVNVLGAGLDKIDLDIPVFRNIADSVKVFRTIHDALRGAFAEVFAVWDAFVAILARWWGYFRILVVVIVLWLGLSAFSGAYMNVQRGLALIRGQPEERVERVEKHPWVERKIIETPPILVVDRSQIRIPSVEALSGADGRGAGQRVLRRQRVLLSAQALWPQRHQELFHYELADELSPPVWARFWQNLIGRGLDPHVVQLVISSETEALAEAVAEYLPNAEIRRSVEMTIVAG